jgi:hypothetical protein
LSVQELAPWSGEELKAAREPESEWVMVKEKVMGRAEYLIDRRM